MTKAGLIALTGATGFVGQAVLDAAQEKGLAVRALTRRDQPERERVEWVRGSLSERGALEELVRGAETVVHVAGLTNAPDPAAFHAANVEGTQNLVDACNAQGVRRMVLVSSLSAREPALSQYGASKAGGEERVIASDLDWTIVRPPAVYGPRDTEMFELFRAAKLGIVPVPLEGRTSIIHVADLARLLVTLALEAPGGSATTGQIYEPGDDNPRGYAHDELARLIGQAVGRTRIFAPGLPAPLLKAAARVDRALRGDGAKLTPDRASYMVHPDWVCDPAKAPPPSLWRAQWSGAAGFATTAEWYLEQGWL